jgi:hypothetical protein
MKIDKLVNKIHIYKINKKELDKINEKINKKMLPNQKKLDREYFSYKAYWKSQYQYKKRSYDGEKERDKKDILSKSQFMALYYKDLLFRT